MPDESRPRQQQRHLLTVWNPAYAGAGDAMEAHVRILLDYARSARDGAAGAGGEVDDEDVYVWWGKIRSQNRMQPMPHLADVLAIDDELRAADAHGGVDASGEVHLYLTDYRSLYVAHVAEVTADDVRTVESERPHVPPDIYDAGVHCDCWFRLFDIRRVVHDDTPAVVDELRKLRNVRYHDRPVSIYGGMIELPLVVTRDDGARWFDATARGRLTDGRFWVEFDAEVAGAGAVAADLRDNVLGTGAWSALDPAARTFVATAEKLFRDHRGDPAFDFSPVVVNIAKAWEVQLAAIFGRVWRRFPDDACRVNVDGRTVHLFEQGAPSLGVLSRAVAEHRPLRDAIARRLTNAAWATASMPSVVAELAGVRNSGAHTGRITREAARAIRDAHLGVGTLGQLVELARTHPI